MKTSLTALLGAGFYRYWHVPAPDGPLGPAAARRADRSIVGPTALTALGALLWAAGRVGAAVHLHAPVTMRFDALPPAARLLVYTAGVVLGTALVWWVGTAPLRARVARGIATGSVARLPDDPPPAAEPLHAAATQLGRALRDLGDQGAVGAVERPGATPSSLPALAAPAFEVLHAASVALTDGSPVRPADRRLRRRCHVMTKRLHAAAPCGRQPRTRAAVAARPARPSTAN